MALSKLPYVAFTSAPAVVFCTNKKPEKDDGAAEMQTTVVGWAYVDLSKTDRRKLGEERGAIPNEGKGWRASATFRPDKEEEGELSAAVVTGEGSGVRRVPYSAFVLLNPPLTTSETLVTAAAKRRNEENIKRLVADAAKASELDVDLAATPKLRHRVYVYHLSVDLNIVTDTKFGDARYAEIVLNYGLKPGAEVVTLK
jgi:hypothetical protein